MKIIGLVISLFCTSIIMSGCNCKNAAFHKTKRVQILLYSNVNKGDTTQVFASTEQDWINKITNFVTTKNVLKHQCGYQGKMVFISDSTTMEAEFSYRKECAYVTYSENKKAVYKELTVDGIQFLEGLSGR